MHSRRSALLGLVQGLLLSLCLLAAGCSKKNDVSSTGGGANAACSDGSACAGACVEGICREFCDANYQCPSNETCTTVENAAVCLPPDAKAHLPYAPVDLLTDCTGPEGCEVALDALGIEGVFKYCQFSERAVTADIESSSFDYEGACSTLRSYQEDLFVKQRTAYRLQEGGSCQVTRVGMAGDDALAFPCPGLYTSYPPDKAVGVAFAHLVQKGDQSYLWQRGSIPFTSPLVDGESDWFYSLQKFFPQAVPDALENCMDRAPTCDLPQFPRIGAAASEFAGLWVQCDSYVAGECTTTWSDPPQDSRDGYYIRDDGLGERLQITGDPLTPTPDTCSAAFRAAGQDQVVALGRHDTPVGTLLALRQEWLIHDCSMPPAEEFLQFCDVGSEGVYLRTEERLLSGETGSNPYHSFYKKMPIPAGFVDPCEASQPRLTF